VEKKSTMTRILQLQVIKESISGIPTYPLPMFRDSFSTKKLASSLGLASTVVVFYFLMYLSSWWVLKIQGIGGGRNFVDLNAVVNSATCYLDIGDKVYEASGECSYQYGIALLKIINFLQLSMIPLALLGTLAMVAILSVFLYLLNMVATQLRFTQLHIFLYLTSPAFWLLFERGNFDWLVFLLLFFGILTINTRLEISGVILIGVAALIKFYALPLLLLLPFLTKKRMTKFVSVITFFVLLPVILWNITLIQSFPNPLFAAFGAPSLGLWLNFFSWRFGLELKISDSISHLAGLIFFIAMSVFIAKKRSLQKFLDLKESPILSRKVDLFYVFFSSAYLICYLAGMNFDYRLIFLVASLILCSASNPKLFGNIIFQIFAHSSIWLTFFFFGAVGAIPVLLALIGNIAQGVMAVIFMYEILTRLDILTYSRTFKHSLNRIIFKAIR
jgi:hypothetical protein